MDARKHIVLDVQLLALAFIQLAFSDEVEALHSTIN